MAYTEVFMISKRMCGFFLVREYEDKFLDYCFLNDIDWYDLAVPTIFSYKELSKKYGNDAVIMKEKSEEEFINGEMNPLHYYMHNSHRAIPLILHHKIDLESSLRGQLIKDRRVKDISGEISKILLEVKRMRWFDQMVLNGKGLDSILQESRRMGITNEEISFILSKFRNAESRQAA